METPLRVHGHHIQATSERYGTLRDSSDVLDTPTTLRDRFVSDGYVFLPGLLDRQLVLDARRELLLKYAVVGEIDDTRPLLDAFAGDRKGLKTANMRAFTESVRTGRCYTDVILSAEILSAVAVLLGGAAQPFDFRWPRLVRPGEGCGFHCDGPYMSRATDRHLSSWIPLGRVEPRQSALMLLEGSHRNEELLDGYLSLDADLDDLVWLDDDPASIQDRYGERWLSATFEPGDVLIFSMNMLHGAFDNVTSRCRLSTDSRYFLRGEVGDPRWNGDNIEPHGPGRVFYPGLGSWGNADFQDEWKYVDANGRLVGVESSAVADES